AHLHQRAGRFSARAPRGPAFPSRFCGCAAGTGSIGGGGKLGRETGVDGGTLVADMFNWICPQCGSEVLASYAECPECDKRAAQPAGTAPASAEPPPTAAAQPSPYQKFVEVTGVRLSQNAKKQVEARFLVVNHSEGELVDMSGTVEIRGRTAKETEEPVGSFTFKVASVGPNESKELTAKV